MLMRCQLRNSQTPPKKTAITSANAPITRKNEDAAEGISDIGNVRGALVEMTGDVVMSVANAKFMETANKNVQSISRRCQSRASRAPFSRPLKCAIILFDSFERLFSNADTTREKANETGVLAGDVEDDQEKIAG